MTLYTLPLPVPTFQCKYCDCDIIVYDIVHPKYKTLTLFIRLITIMVFFVHSCGYQALLSIALGVHEQGIALAQRRTAV